LTSPRFNNGFYAKIVIPFFLAGVKMASVLNLLMALMFYTFGFVLNLVPILKTKEFCRVDC